MNPSSPVSIADTNDARMQGTATAKLGSSLGEFGDQLGKLQKAERDIEFSKQKNVLEAESMVALEEAKVSGEKDIPKAYQKIYQAKVSKVMEGAPKDDDVLYSQMTDFASQAETIGQKYAQVEQLKVGEQSVLNKFTEAKNSHLNVVRTNPADLSARFKAFDAEVLQPAANVSGIDGKKRSDLDLAARADFGYAAVDGFIEKKQFGQALRLLNAKTTGTVEIDGVKVPMEMTDTSGKPLSDEEVSIMAALPAAQKDQLRDRIRVKGESEATMRIGDINGRMKDVRVAMENGIPVNPNEFKKIGGMIDQTNLPATAKAIMKDTALNMATTAQYANKMRGATVDDMQKILAEARQKSLRGKPGDPAFNMERRQQDYDLLEKVYTNAIQKRIKDGPGAALESEPDLEVMRKASLGGDQGSTVKYLDASTAQQKRLGIAQPQVLQPDEVLNYGQMLKAAPNPETLVGAVQQMQSKYGRYAQQAIMEAAKENDEYKMLAFAYDPQSQQRMAQNIMSKKSINEDLKRQDNESAKLIKESAKATAFRAMMPYAQTLNQAYPNGEAGGLLSAMQAQVETEAIKQKLTGNTSAKPEKILTESFSVVSRGNQMVVVPKMISGQTVDSEKIGNFMESTVTPQGLQKLGIMGNPKDTPEKAQERLSRQSAAAKWIPSPELDAIVLTVNGSMALDKDRRPIMVPLTDVEKKYRQLMGGKLSDQPKPTMEIPF